MAPVGGQQLAPSKAMPSFPKTAGSRREHLPRCIPRAEQGSGLSSRRRDSEEPHEPFSTAPSGAWTLSYLSAEITHFAKLLLVINLEIVSSKKPQKPTVSCKTGCTSACISSCFFKLHSFPSALNWAQLSSALGGGILQGVGVSQVGVVC